MKYLDIKRPAGRFSALAAAGLLLIAAFNTQAEQVSERSPVFDSPDLMSRYLAAEINANRGALKSAFSLYRDVAIAAREAIVARRAALIGLHLKLPEAGEAVELWTELEADNSEAWQALLILRLKEGNYSDARVAAEALMSSAKKHGKDGFLEIASAVTGAADAEPAIALFESIAHAHRRDPAAHYALGVALFGMRHYEKAENALRQALALDKQDARYWLLLSRVLTALERGSEAEKLLETAIAHLPDERLLKLTYAESLVTQQNYKLAYSIYRELLEQQPDNHEMRQVVGVLGVELGRWQEAREQWLYLLDDPEKENRARFFLGQVETALGNLEDATDYFNAVEDPLKSDAHVQLAKIAIESGRFEEAHVLLEQRRQDKPSDLVALYLAEADLFREAGMIERAITLLDVVLEEMPDQTDLLYTHGMLSAEIGDVDALEAKMRRVLAINPDHAEALNALGYTLADETSRFAEALELISKALELMPDSPAILDSMGWVLYKLGRYDESLVYLTKAAQKEDDGEIAAHLGEVLWAAGKHRQALDVWESGLRREPENAHIVEAMQRLNP